MQVEEAAGEGVAHGDEGGDIVLDAELGQDEAGAADPEPEAALGGHALVDAGVAFGNAGVDHAGQAVAVAERLRLGDALDVIVVGDRGHAVVRPFHRAFVQHAGRLAPGVAGEEAVVGVGRVAGEAEGGAAGGVEAGGVEIGREDMAGPVGHGAVEIGAAEVGLGKRAGVVGHAEHPFAVMPGGEVRQPVEQGVVGHRAGQVGHGAVLIAAVLQVDMGILHPRQHHPPPGVDHLGQGAFQLGDVVIAADGEDLSVVHRQRRGARQERIHRDDVAIHEDRVGHGPSHRCVLSTSALQAAGLRGRSRSGRTKPRRWSGQARPGGR